MRRGLIFFALLCLGGLTPFVLQGWRDWKVFREYAETRCTVLSISSYDGHPELSYRLTVEGSTYFASGFDNTNGRLASMMDTNPFRVGDTYPCWYDPADPERAVLVRRIHAGFYAASAIPGAMLLIVSSMAFRGRKPRRVKTSQGTVLPVRLAPDTTASSRVVLASVLMLAGIAALAGMLWLTLMKPALLFFTAVLLVFGAGVVRFFVLAIRTRHLADPLIEIDREPALPGSTMRIHLQQPEPAQFTNYRVVLQSEEDEEKRHVLFERDEVRTRLAESFTAKVPKKSGIWKLIVQRQHGKDAIPIDYRLRVWPADGIHSDEE